MRRILINGDRACFPVDGMNRVLLEIIKHLDAVVEEDKYTLVIPSDVSEEFYDKIKNLKNIKIRKTLLPHFRFWTFLFVDIAGLLPDTIEINFDNRSSVFGGGINILHDIIPIRFYGNQNRRYLRKIKRLLNTSDSVIVPSEFTRDNIKETLKCGREIQVVHHGWQHYPDIQEDCEIFNEYPHIKKGSFFYTISSISPHKNLRFIYEIAKRNPNRQFVIAGSMNRGYGFEYNELKNLIIVGRISDKKAKALMMNCRAFIFPSVYEGAGIPPLEALSCKVPVLTADIKVLHEYCGNSVHYFDPYDYDLDLEDALNTKVSPPEDALDLLSWDKAAQDLKNIIEMIK